MKKIILKNLIILLLIFGITDISFAQSEVDLNKDYWKGYVYDTKALIAAPTRWDSRDWIKASLFAGITVGLYAFDQDIHDWVQENRNKTSDDISKFAKPFGEGIYTLPPLAIFYLYGHYFDNKKAKRAALLSLESFVATGIFTQVIKFSGHRHRPSSGDSSTTWDGPGLSSFHSSFPSGHASSAFAIATVIASEYENMAIIPPLSYGIATLTALSRVNDNAHWASDVFFGSGIGYFTGKAIVSLHNGKEDRKLAIIPVINGKYNALLISYNF